LYLWYWVLYLPYSKIQRLTARSRSQSKGRASSRPRPRPRPEIFEAKAKATKFCPRAVLEVEASPRGPHPCINFLIEVIYAQENLYQKLAANRMQLYKNKLHHFGYMHRCKFLTQVCCACVTDTLRNTLVSEICTDACTVSPLLII